MHTEIMDFLKRARNEAGLSSLAGLRVVELGSFVINGTPRDEFTGAASYIGVDWRAGKGVDVVSLAHAAPIDRADVVLCCQMLEHDPFWRRTVEKACEMLTDGGWFFCTWAGPGYCHHEQETAPPWEGTGAYYGNLTVEEVAAKVLEFAPHAKVTTDYRRGTLDALLWARM